MAFLAELGTLAVDRKLLSAAQAFRTSIPAKEHQMLPLPAELIRPDGSLDIYQDVLKRFNLTYQGNRPAIQTTGWVGYIPLNDYFALDIGPRVPVGNLERLLRLATGYTPNILRKYTRRFAHTAERPDSFVDVLADQLIDAFDHIWDYGLLKTYKETQRVGSSPVGRIKPFESACRTVKTGRPVAASSSFHRTIDFGPNRVLRVSFEKLLTRYLETRTDGQRGRTLKLKKAFERLSGVGRPMSSEISPEAIASYVQRLPLDHEQYADALMIAQIVLSDSGLAIRGDGGVAILPSLLINMALVFEDYIRRVLRDGLLDDGDVEVKDGNKGGGEGAKVFLFDPPPTGVENPGVTPDIVISVAGRTRLVIDAKYKKGPRLPDRNDISQVILYGARYDANRVMVLHAGRPADRQNAEFCGRIGTFDVYNGMMDLNAPSIEAEEAAFVSAVRALL
ncbi:MAG: McrC family protein [Mesorhizobium sp.]|nr:McrC family protein [Mesorhizobium sp.]